MGILDKIFGIPMAATKWTQGSNCSWAYTHRLVTFNYYSMFIYYQGKCPDKYIKDQLLLNKEFVLPTWM